ncbi:MAG: adenylate/guanylate cyclase domain-containing protein [Bdellovibrionota bacterium]
MARSEDLTILFTDIVGFTARTSRQSRAENAAMLRAHDQLLLPMVGRYGGRRIKSIGDSLLCVFHSPTDGVKCGMAMHDALWAYNQKELPERQIHLRVAINLGEVRLEGRDVFGEPVNLASRLEKITPTDEIYFTEAVHLAMNRAEVPVQFVGEEEFRGIAGTVKLFHVPAHAAAPLAAGGEGALPANGFPYGGMHLGISDSAPPLTRLAYRADLWRERAAVNSRKWARQAAQNLKTAPGRMWNAIARVSKAPLLLGFLLLAAAAGGYVYRSLTRHESHAALKPARLVPPLPPPTLLENVPSASLLEAQEGNMRDGRWKAVEDYAQGLLRQTPPAGEALLLLGHVAFSRGELSKGLEYYHRALEAHPELRDDGRLIANAIAALDRVGGKAGALFRKHPGEEGLKALAARAGRPGYEGRRWAVDTLEALQEGGRIPQGERALLDFKEAPDCPLRREALLLLRKLRERRALPAVREITDTYFFETIRRENACLYDEAADFVRELETR